MAIFSHYVFQLCIPSSKENGQDKGGTVAWCGRGSLDCKTSRCILLHKNLEQCGKSFQSHGLILNMQFCLQNVAVTSNYVYLFKYGLLVHS